MRWASIFIILSLCIVGTVVADDWNTPFGTYWDPYNQPNGGLPLDPNDPMFRQLLDQAGPKNASTQGYPQDLPPGSPTDPPTSPYADPGYPQNVPPGSPTDPPTGPYVDPGYPQNVLSGSPTDPPTNPLEYQQYGPDLTGSYGNVGSQQYGPDLTGSSLDTEYQQNAQLVVPSDGLLSDLGYQSDNRVGDPANQLSGSLVSSDDPTDLQNGALSGVQSLENSLISTSDEPNLLDNETADDPAAPSLDPLGDPTDPSLDPDNSGDGILDDSADLSINQLGDPAAQMGVQTLEQAVFHTTPPPTPSYWQPTWPYYWGSYYYTYNAWPYYYNYYDRCFLLCYTTYRPWLYYSFWPYYNPYWNQVAYLGTGGFYSLTLTRTFTTTTTFVNLGMLSSAYPPWSLW